MKNPLGKNSAFTIIELLITIGILIVLASSVVVYLNPGERLAEGRDSRRTNELNQISAGLRLVYTQGKIKGNANTVYLSLPDSSATCGSYSLPQLPSGWTYACAPSSTYLNVDGTGWIPVNFNTIPGGSTLSSIPIDPRNTQDFYYAYAVDPTDSTYDVTALMESEKHIKLAARSDNGVDDGRYEVGSKLSLWNNISLLVGKWSFDESGNTAYDLSGENNNLQIRSLITRIPGKVGQAIKYDATTSGSCVNQDAGVYSNSLSANMKDLPDAAFTLSWWNRLPTDSGSSRIHLGTSVAVSGCGNCSIWNLRTSTEIRTSAANDDLGFSRPTDGQWHHYTFVFNKTNLLKKMYIDGKLINQGVLSGGDYGKVQWIGIGIYTPSCVDGIPSQEIDEVRINKRMLTDEEIFSVYKAGK